MIIKKKLKKNFLEKKYNIYAKFSISFAIIFTCEKLKV